jgi:hypothetical protein
MKLKSSLMIVFGALALLALGDGQPTQAGERKRTIVYADGTEHPKARYYRKRTRVYGYAARRGGYSYRPDDVVNTYGLTRSLYGSMNSYRDPSLDRQTTSGPFDHGFFFDSGMGPRGGDSPYLH